MRYNFFLILLVILVSTEVYATIDYLTVNHITDQLYWAETDHPPGWIGWETIPESTYESVEKKYLEMGYAFTENPYLIEELMAAFLVLFLLALWISKIRKEALKRRL